MKKAGNFIKIILLLPIMIPRTIFISMRLLVIHSIFYMTRNDFDYLISILLSDHYSLDKKNFDKLLETTDLLKFTKENNIPLFDLDKSHISPCDYNKLSKKLNEFKGYRKKVFLLKIESIYVQENNSPQYAKMVTDYSALIATVITIFVSVIVATPTPDNADNTMLNQIQQMHMSTLYVVFFILIAAFIIFSVLSRIFFEKNSRKFTMKYKFLISFFKK